MNIVLRAKYRLFLSDVNKLEFSRNILGKHSNIKFHENQSTRNRVVPCGQSDRHDKANTRFWQCFERA